jgi:hypothetical protein
MAGKWLIARPMPSALAMALPCTFSAGSAT